MTVSVFEPDAVLAAEFPPEVNIAKVLRPLRTASWEVSSQYRRSITRTDPLLFALTYLGRYLMHPDTGTISFSRMHLDMCSAARYWVRPQGTRNVWIAPRYSGKTMWKWHALPLWALAHGHRRFMLAFANVDKQAKGHLANLLEDLRYNDLLLNDFPDLEIRRGQGGADRTVLQSGATIATRGMGATTLGARSGPYRPDMMVGDDLEKGEAANTPREVAKNRSRLLTSILPMNPYADVDISGTVTMYNSLMHQFVHAAKGRRGGEWVRANHFNVKYYAPFGPDGQSMWPQLWSKEWLEAERAANRHGFALNYENDPPPPSDITYWTEESFQYDERFPVAERVLHIDTAVSTKTTSDFTALVLAGVDASQQKALVEHVEWGHWSAPEIRNRIHRVCEPLRIKPFVRVEANQGGDTWLDSLAPWPVGVQYETTRAQAPKEVRIKWAHAHYHRRAVWHPWRNRALENVLIDWQPGGTERDDVPDGIAGALEWCFRDQVSHR